MKSEHAVGEIIEVSRFRFRAHVNLAPYLRSVRFEVRPGGEYQIRPEDYAKAIRLLKDNQAFQLRTARDLQDNLGWLNYSEVRTRPQWLEVENPESWSFISPVARRWRKCLANKSCILIRPRWTLIHHRPGRPEFFFFEDGKRLEDCRMAGDQAIHRGYEGVLGTLPVPFWRSENLLFALWPGYVIPKKHEHFLTQTLSASDTPLPTEEGDVIWCWYAEDMGILENIFRGLHLRFTDWDPGENWLHIASLIMRRAYTYLRRRDGAQELSSIIRQRAWHQIADDQLRETIKQLCMAEWRGTNAATALLYFIESQLCVELDWQVYGERIEGWMIESSAVIYDGREREACYYRLVVPRFDTVLGWQTKRQRDWDGDQRPKVNIYNWRSAPVLGRLKTASAGKAPETVVAGREFRNIALRSLLAMPSVEWELAQQLTVGAFLLDLDGTHWRGVNDLCRYFSGYGRYIARNASECDGYGVLLEDAMGRRFALETHILLHKDLEALSYGEWLHFVANSSVLRHQAWRQLERDVPVFELKLRELFRRAQEEEVLRSSLLAMIKYHFGIQRQDLLHFFDAKWEGCLLAQQLDQLLAEGEIVEYKGKLYYRYASLTPRQMTEFLEKDRESTSTAFYLLRPMLHPLYIRSVNLAQEAALIPSEQRRGVRIIGLKAVMDEEALRREVISELSGKGIVRLAARGRQVQRALNLIGDLVVERPNIQVRRYDGVHEFEDGEVVQQVEYVVNDSVRQLQIRLGSNRKA